MRRFKCIANSRKSPLTLPYWVTVGEVYTISDIFNGEIRIMSPFNKEYWLNEVYFEEVF